MYRVLRRYLGLQWIVCDWIKVDKVGIACSICGNRNCIQGFDGEI